MAAMDNPHIQSLEDALQDWKDHRFVTRDEVRAAAMFLLYLVNLADQGGWQYDGHSWKESAYLGCLTVKATVDGVPSVAFTNAKTPIASMRIFLRKVDADLIEWVPDKYRQ